MKMISIDYRNVNELPDKDFCRIYQQIRAKVNDEGKVAEMLNMRVCDVESILSNI